MREDCGWTGALGAYPDHGVFAAPEWVFYELDNQEAIEYIEGWVKTYNVQASCAWSEGLGLGLGLGLGSGSGSGLGLGKL